MAIGPRGAAPTVRAGLAVFVVGLVAVAVTFVAYASGAHDRPVWQNLLCMLAPLGFGIAVWGLVREGRDEARSAQARIDGAAATGSGPAGRTGG